VKTLQDLLQQTHDVSSCADLLSIVRQTLIACSDQLRTDIAGSKCIRNAFYRSNKALAAWESERAFGVSRTFKPFPPKDEDQ